MSVFHVLSLKLGRVSLPGSGLRDCQMGGDQWQCGGLKQGGQLDLDRCPTPSESRPFGTYVY